MHLPTTPRVSVVVPLYQKGPYVRRALESVFRQTFEDFEVVVVDDGSTDDASRVLAEIVEPRLIVERQEHRGVSAARNRGVALSRGSWVAFLDADDEWLPAFLKTMIDIADANPGVSAVFSNLWDSPTRRPVLSRIGCRGALVDDYFAALIENDGMGMSSSSTLASKERLVTCGGFSESATHYEDMELWARLAWSGDIGFCSASLAIYHSDVPHSASKNKRAAIIPYPAVLRAYEEWSAAGRIPEKLRRSSRRYANWFLAWNVMELAHQGLGKEGRQRLDEAGWRDAADPLHWKAWMWTWLPHDVLRTGRRFRSWFKGRLDTSPQDPPGAPADQGNPLTRLDE
jgi:glycosyltransferase involved in cell wall biosynthesis